MNPTNASPSEIRQLIAQLFETLRKHSAAASLDALKKPGAWLDKPASGPGKTQPIYVKLPCRIAFVNVPGAALRAQILSGADENDFEGNATRTIVPLLRKGAARSAAGATRLASRASSLRSRAATAPSAHLPALLRSLKNIDQELERIIAGNQRVSGEGSLQDPFSVDRGQLYVSAPITLAWPGVPPGEASYAVRENTLFVSVR